MTLVLPRASEQGIDTFRRTASPPRSVWGYWSTWTDASLLQEEKEEMLQGTDKGRERGVNKASLTEPKVPKRIITVLSFMSKPQPESEVITSKIRPTLVQWKSENSRYLLEIKISLA